MAKSTTFKVSKKGHEGFTVQHERVPETIEEFVSLGLVQKEEDVIDLAHQNLVIKIQAGARARLDQGEEAVQQYVNDYTFGARTGGGGARKATVSTSQAKDLRFTKAQIEALKAAGVSFVEDTEEEEAEAAEE